MPDPLATVQADRPAKPRLYLHIGHYKTGSSAIQKYLSTHTDALREDGYHYIAAARHKGQGTNHAQIAIPIAEEHGFVRPAWYTDTVTVDEAFRAFHFEALENPGFKFILSSEELVQLALRDDPQAAVSDLCARLSDYDVRIVFYIREPMSLLKSWYNEVNKGKRGTRNFPTFFMNLNWVFLAQERIWQIYAEAFGPDNIIIRPYRHKRNAHIQDFLETIATSHRPPAEVEMVQLAKPLEELEVARVRKAGKDNFDTATLSTLSNARRMFTKSEKIAGSYRRLKSRCPEADPCELSAVSVMTHYDSLVSVLAKNGMANEQEANNLYAIAIRIEKSNPALAEIMVRIAKTICPENDAFEERLQSYHSRLEVAPVERTL